jgi:uracil-DNA glycosylase
MDFADFVTWLADTAVPPHTFNQYSPDQLANAARRINLHRYLHQMRQIQPTVLLVGEAPGYRGCRLTGIPFMSPALLQSGLNGSNSEILGGFQTVAEWPTIRKEASATIVWETLRDLPSLPLLWNAFPFHPHKPGHPQTNRTPKQSELACGRPFLIELLRHFPIQTVVAVGNKAESALTNWEILYQKVRHPSHGGKAAFVRGVQQIVGTAVS